MATNAYLYQFPSEDACPARILRNNATAFAVNAESTADALATLKSLYSDLPSFMFDRASEVSVAQSADMLGWKLRVKVAGAFSSETNSTPIVADVEVTADSTGAVAATQTLTLDNSANNVTDGDTVTIGAKVYTFKGTLDNVDGHVHIGASGAASMTNLFHAINGAGGTSGTDYAAATVANTQVTATNPSGTTVVITAITAGHAANSIATTETSSHLSWGAATMTGGYDANSLSSLAAKAVAALNVTADITHAAFNSTSRVFTVAGTADVLGDHRIIAAFMAPAADSNQMLGIPGFIAAQVDGGASSDALTLTLAADSYTIPTAVALLGQSVAL